jgi:peptidoglycan hydrolase-like protein with peptidoglycan-binding domain
MRSAILTRARFGAYDPEVWVVQTYLSQLGFSPGTIDGQWGGNTTSAALAFRSWAGLGPASGLTKAGIVDEEFWTQIDRAVASAGFDINITAPSSMPGGSGTGPVVQPVATRPPAAQAPAPAAGGGIGGLPMLALAAIGLGAVIVLGGKKRR